MMSKQITLVLAVFVVMLLATLHVTHAARQIEMSIRCETGQGRVIFTLEPDSWTSWRFTFDPPAGWVGGICRITY